MILAASFLDLMPTFRAGAQRLHDILAPVALLFCFIGLLVMVVHAFKSQSVIYLWPTFIRIFVAGILVMGIANFGDTINSAVRDIVAQTGFNSGNVFQDYLVAVQQKFGSNSAVNQSPGAQSSNVPVPLTEGDTSGGFTQPTNGVRVTHYGYAGDPTPDSNSSQGIGAFSFDSVPHSLTPLYSAALSPDVAAQYNLQPGQTFTAGLANGQTVSLQYADVTSSDLTGRVDVYDPQNALTFDGIGITSINGGPVTAGQDQGFFGGLASKIGDSITTALLFPLVYLLSLIALGCMWIMTGVQQILYLVEIAVSPIFVGLIVVPALVGLASRFFTSLIAICLWPLGWIITDLGTKALIDLAINPANNPSGGVPGGPSLLLGYWVVLAIWVILSSFLAPLIVSASLIGGSSGIAALLGATLGAATIRAVSIGSAAVGGPVGAARIAGGVISGASGIPSRVMGPIQNYARRPMTANKEEGAS